MSDGSATEHKKKPLVAIYALIDPRDGSPRYVGQSKQPTRRLQQHCRLSNNRGGTPRNTWLRKLIRLGLKPQMQILEWTGDWDEAERRLIAQYRSQGARLTNVAIGGHDLSHATSVPHSPVSMKQWTPLQFVRIRLADYRNHCKRRSPEELAHAEHLIATVDERVKRTLKKMGHVEGLAYLNLGLAERHAARAIRYG
jgi:hypothetical protein